MHDQIGLHLTVKYSSELVDLRTQLVGIEMKLEITDDDSPFQDRRPTLEFVLPFNLD